MKVPQLFAVVLLLAAASFAQVPSSNHVVIVLEENKSFSTIYNSSYMPYLNSLAKQNALAMKSYGNTHPSIGNYFMLTTGQIITNSDGYTGTVSINNMARAMITAGVTWKVYAESLPYAGYTGGDKYPYAKHHNPFAYFTDVINSSSEKLNIVPFSQFATDVQNGTLPQFSFVIPNMQNNAHDCPKGMSSCSTSQKLSNADNWLKTNMSPLLASPEFQQDGLLIVTFDESSSTDTAYGGGHIFTTVIGPKVKKGYQSTTLYQHQSVLRTMLAALGITNNLPGKSSTATLMSDMFGTSSPSSGSSTTCTASTTTLPSVTICAPTASSTVASPVQVVAAAASATTVTTTQIWLDGVKVYQVSSNKVNTSVAMSSGTHRLTVQAKDSAGTTFKKTIYVTAN